MGLWMPLSYMMGMNNDRQRSMFIATSMNTHHVWSMIIEIAMITDRQWSLIITDIVIDQWSLLWNAVDHTWSVLINGLYHDPYLGLFFKWIFLYLSYLDMASVCCKASLWQTLWQWVTVLLFPEKKVDTMTFDNIAGGQLGNLFHLLPDWQFRRLQSLVVRERSEVTKVLSLDISKPGLLGCGTKLKRDYWEGVKTNIWFTCPESGPLTNPCLNALR